MRRSYSQILGALVLASCLCAPPVFSEVRSSLNYTLESETLDGGGGLNSSASFQNFSSLDPVVAGKAIANNITVHHGFVTALTILAEYESWASARGLSVGVNDGYFDDPNSDGLPNINHFAFDSDPLGFAGEECKRRIGSTVIADQDYLTLTLPIRNGAAFSGLPLQSNVVDGLRYEILGDTELVDPWVLQVVELIPAQDAGLPVLGDYDANPGADWSYRTFRLLDPLSASPRYFMKAGVLGLP